MMYTKRRKRETNPVGWSIWRLPRSWGRVEVLIVALLVTTLAVLGLSVGSEARAAALAGVPCQECAAASDPVEYTRLVSKAEQARAASNAASTARYGGLAGLYAGERETDVPSVAALSLGIPSDPTQLVPLSATASASRETDVTREASFGLGVPADPTHLKPAVVAFKVGRATSEAASTARYNAQAVFYGRWLDRANSAYGRRLEALADCYEVRDYVCSSR